MANEEALQAQVAQILQALHEMPQTLSAAIQPIVAEIKGVQKNQSEMQQRVEGIEETQSSLAETQESLAKQMQDYQARTDAKLQQLTSIVLSLVERVKGIEEMMESSAKGDITQAIPVMESQLAQSMDVGQVTICMFDQTERSLYYINDAGEAEFFTPSDSSVLGGLLETGRNGVVSWSEGKCETAVFNDVIPVEIGVPVFDVIQSGAASHTVSKPSSAAIVPIVTDSGSVAFALVGNDKPLDESKLKIDKSVVAALNSKSNYDGKMLSNLTKLPNQAAFEQYCRQQVRSTLAAQKPVSFIGIDIDHFKRFNDTYSHDAGDEALRHVGRLLHEHLRQAAEREGSEGLTDVVFHLHGEEMTVVCPNATEEEAVKIANRLREAIQNNPIIWAGKNGELPPTELPVTISCGVATITPEQVQGKTDAEIVQLIDQTVYFSDNSLYAAKNNGRNSVFASQGTIVMDDIGGDLTIRATGEAKAKDGRLLQYSLELCLDADTPIMVNGTAHTINDGHFDQHPEELILGLQDSSVTFPVAPEAKSGFVLMAEVQPEQDGGKEARISIVGDSKAANGKFAECTVALPTVDFIPAMPDNGVSVAEFMERAVTEYFRSVEIELAEYGCSIRSEDRQPQEKAPAEEQKEQEEAQQEAKKRNTTGKEEIQ